MEPSADTPTPDASFDGGDPDGRDLVKKLGTASVAAALGQSMSCVSNWTNRGVPRAHRFLVAQMAQQSNLPVPDGFLPKLRSGT